MSWNTSFMEKEKDRDNLSGAAARLVAFREDSIWYISCQMRENARKRGVWP